MRRHALAALALALIALSPPAAGRQAGDGFWYAEGADGEVVVKLHFFWSRLCPHCTRALPFVEDLAVMEPWLELKSYELTSEPANAQLYVDVAASLGLTATSVPAFAFCETLFTGFDDTDTTGRVLAAQLRDCRERRRQALAGRTDMVPASAQPATITLPLLGEVKAADLALPLFTVVVAGMDALNPCAFFVLLFLLTLLVHARSRRRVVFIGGVFVIFSGLIYFAFMAAWLNVFLWLGELRVVTVAAGLIAVAIGVVNVKDYFLFRQGVSLSIPESAKPGLFQRMRMLTQAGGLWPMVIGTVTLAVAANSYELLCTAGFPMVYTRVLTLHELDLATYYLYLAFYNVIYVMPLAIIVSVFAMTLGSRKLSEREGRVLKLASGLMMLGLGSLLLLRPEMLGSVTAAASILFVAVAGTYVVTRLDRHRDKSRD